MIDLQTQKLIIALVIIGMTLSVTYITLRIIREVQSNLRGGHPLDR